MIKWNILTIFRMVHCILVCQRKGQKEFRTFIHFASERDFALMQFNKRSYQLQSDTTAYFTGVYCIIRSEDMFEDMPLFAGGDSDTGILDAQIPLMLVYRCFNTNLSSIRSIFDCIG